MILFCSFVRFNLCCVSPFNLILFPLQLLCAQGGGPGALVTVPLFLCVRLQTLFWIVTVFVGLSLIWFGVSFTLHIPSVTGAQGKPRHWSVPFWLPQFLMCLTLKMSWSYFSHFKLFLEHVSSSLDIPYLCAVCLVLIKLFPWVYFPSWRCLLACRFENWAVTCVSFCVLLL